ncbi:unnamed protein product [Mytilus coruscus]|uniref:Endonuclease/exonuclease/phosphatase domain-containing protein n=1 Tax=Mytilus coruscus TaxID=42192 RepID=A0A6J8D5R5_MYTCO|nr:unnamed protein product [Mytilus coruscus]
MSENDPSQSKVNDSVRKWKKKASSKNRMSTPYDKSHLKQTRTTNGSDNGDFNTSLGAFDRGGKTNHKEDKAVCALKWIINDNVLCDVYRKRNPDVSVFQEKKIVENNLRQSRIDFHLISLGLKPFVKNIYHTDSSFSDHSFVSMVLDFRTVATGPGLWILNNLLLDHDIFVENIKKIIHEEVYSDFYFSSPLTWYDNLKSIVLSDSPRCIVRINKKIKNRDYYRIQNRLQEMSAKEDNGVCINMNQYEDLNSKLAEIEKIKCKCAILRSNAFWSVYGDKNTAYSLQLEKQRQ